MIPNSGLIVSPTEPTGNNRRKVWMQHSNNIFNKMTSTKNQYIDDNGNYGQSEISDLSDFIPVITNTNYIAKGYGNTAQNKRIAFFDSSKAFISAKTSLKDTNSTFYFKTLSNASYIRVQYFKDIEDSLDITIEPKIYVKNDNDVYEEFININQQIKAKTYSNAFANVSTSTNVDFKTMFPDISLNQIICFNVEIDNVYSTWDRVYAHVLYNTTNPNYDKNGQLQIRSYAETQTVSVKVTAFYK